MANTTGYDLLEPSRPSANSVSRADKATENTIYLFDPTTSLRSFLLTGGTSDGDNIAINGLSNSFKVSTKGNTITLTGIKNTESQGVKVSISMDKTGGTDKLWFADGSVDVTFTPNSTGKGGSWTIGGNKIGKKADLSKIDYTITESQTFAAAETVVQDGTGANTFNLTVGVDNVVGTAGKDVINAFNVDPVTGEAASTFSSFDSIDGGAGSDTMNLYVSVSGTDRNDTFPSTASVKNVEVVNVNYTDESSIDSDPSLADISNYEGIQQFWQVNASRDVIEATSAVTLGYRDVPSTHLNDSITMAEDETIVNIALDNSAGHLHTIGATTVNVGGELAEDGAFELNVDTTGTATSITVNTAVATTIKKNTPAVVTLNAGGSTGDITFDADTTVATITTGSGDDDINVSLVTEKLNVKTGSGDDSINIGSRIRTASDRIDGGAGDDVATITATATYTDDQLVVLRNIITNVETLAFANANLTTTLDASKLNKAFENLAFVGTVDGEVTKVTTENIVAMNGADLEVTASGYVSTAVATLPNPASFGGNLKVTVSADKFADANGALVEETLAPFVLQSAVEVNGANVTLNVVAENTEENRSGSVSASGLIAVDRLTGDAQTITANLTSAVNTKGTKVDNNFALVSINAENNADLMPNLTSVTLTGNGIAFVQNETASKLATINASGLNSTLLADYVIDTNDFILLFGGNKLAPITDNANKFANLMKTTYGGESLDAGQKSFGLIFDTSAADVKETVTLSGGIDVVTINSGSTFEKMDRITGLNLEMKAGTTNTLSNQSDMLLVGSSGFVKLTTEQKTEIDTAAGNNIELYLTEVAKLTTQDNVVFQLNGNTYVFVDSTNSGTDLLDPTDTVVELVGNINLDALLVSLNLQSNL